MMEKYELAAQRFAAEASHLRAARKKLLAALKAGIALNETAFMRAPGTAAWLKQARSVIHATREDGK